MPGKTSFFFAIVVMDWACNTTERAEKVTVVLNQNPNLLWHGEGNMLPTGIRQHGSLGFYPLVGEFLSAGWAETGSCN